MNDLVSIGIHLIIEIFMIIVLCFVHEYRSLVEDDLKANDSYPDLKMDAKTHTAYKRSVMILNIVFNLFVALTLFHTYYLVVKNG